MLVQRMALLSMQCSPRASAVFTIVFLCGWYHFQFIKPGFLWEGLQIKVADACFFSPSSHSSSLCVFPYSYTAECCSEHDFVSEPLILSLGPLCSPLCVCVCVELILLCWRNMAQQSSFNSFAPYERSLLKQARPQLVYCATIHNRSNK